MAGSGVLHLVKPEPYERIVPRALGDAGPYVFYSGLAELLMAALLLAPKTRRWGGRLTAALLVVVFPGNVQMALDGAAPGGNWFTGSDAMLWLRLPLQPLLIWWAWTFSRREDDYRAAPELTRSPPTR